ncbi:amidase signature enzyme, partial [Penicillium macrosclerotiorum]|uniref:amidase signature enzyme n=1 Tax=Penicillium macrosclerotiorum TaxID=303699 RepID=UPI002548F3D7
LLIELRNFNTRIMTLNVLTTNAIELQQLLKQEKFTSAQIVAEYLAQIDCYEPVLNALISPAPRDHVLEIAKTRDEERRNEKIRSPFHGVPIILKDNFMTASNLGMSTTAGSYVFDGAKVLKNGAITQRLIDAGLIILGKANMTEFAGMKMTMMMPDDNETILGHSAPGGSSTGSAVAAAAGFNPLSMATETIGSIVTPSIRAGLYALKPTIGTQDTTGLYTMTEFFDSPGPMAKSAADVRVLSETLLGRLFEKSHSWEGLSIGFLDPKLWNMLAEFCKQFEGTAEQMVDEYEEMVANLRSERYSLRYPVYCKDPSVLPATILPIALSGYPIATVPIGQLRYKSRPFGLCLVARADKEETLLQFMEEYEKIAQPRPVPRF